MSIKKYIPQPVRQSIRRAIQQASIAGWSRYCPICERHSRRFLTAGVALRPDATCPWCGSVERHRFFWLYFRQQKRFFDGTRRRLLHIAPEPMLEKKFRAIPGIDYLSGDLFDPGAMEQIDITDIRSPDDSFDLIVCSHVLEHVADDRKAISEFFRVLKPGGTAYLLVPIGSARTFEDPSVTDPDERLRLFGQKDHVRQYGPDFEDRLAEAGFAVTRVESAEMLSPRQIRKLSVRPEVAFPIFACTK